jgi:hypothetical protein
MKTYNLNTILPFGSSYYSKEGAWCLLQEENPSDLSLAIKETLFFEGGRQGVSKTGIFIYDSGREGQVLPKDLLNINLN